MKLFGRARIRLRDGDSHGSMRSSDMEGNRSLDGTIGPVFS